MCAESVRGGGNSFRFGSPGSYLGAHWWIGAVLIAPALLVAGCWVLGLWRIAPMVNDPVKALEEMKAEIQAQREARKMVVAAAQLLDDFQNNRDADQKYKGKYLEISGLVERTGVDGAETPFVILHAGDEHAKIKIECFFEEELDGGARVGRLRQGQTITVRGEYFGRVSNVQIRDCELVFGW
jgi:hypothetical protein